MYVYFWAAMESLGEEEEASDGPLPWKNEGPPTKPVSEAQARDFEGTFRAAREQLERLWREYEDLRGHKERELKLAKDLVSEHRSIEQERTTFDKTANILAGEVGQIPKANKTQAKATAENTRLEMYEIQMARRSIQELKQKRDALQSVFGVEKAMWKTQRQRLLALIEQLEVENETMKLTIEQAQSVVEEDLIDDTVKRNPESMLFQALSPRSEKRRPAFKTALDRAIAAQSEAVQLPEAQNEPLCFTDFAIAFDYWPSLPGVPSADGREIKFDNGEVALIFKDGRKKLKRAECSHVLFPNGDVQVDFDDGRVVYRYKRSNAIEVTMKDGTTQCLFSNGQREIRFLNGDKYIAFTDGSTKYAKSNGDYRITRSNGSVESSINGALNRSGPFESP
jgi:hypothetical protein